MDRNLNTYSPGVSLINGIEKQGSGDDNSADFAGGLPQDGRILTHFARKRRKRHHL